MGKRKEFLDAYIRVSTTAQKKEGNSLTVQTTLAKNVAKTLGMELRLHNEDAKSSTKGTRDVLAEVKDGIKRKTIKNLWVQDRSRIFRDTMDGMIFRTRYLQPNKVVLYEGELPNKIDFNLLTPTERSIYDIITSLQQIENEERREKSVRGKLHRLREDGVKREKPVYLGGTPLFGFKNVNKEWKVDKEKSQWVKWMFDAAERGVSIKEIKDTLDQNDVPPARTKSGLWNTTTIRLMLQNKTYTGLHTVKPKKKIGEDSNRKPIFESLGEFTYKVPTIVKTGQFNRVQKLIANNRKNHSNNKQHFSLLEDILVCECGTHIGSHVKNTTSSLGYKVNTRKYYCVSKNYDWRDGKGRECVNKMSLQMDKTNDFVLQRVLHTASQSSLLKSKFKTEVLDEVFAKRKDISDSEKKLEKKLELKQREIEELEHQIANTLVRMSLEKENASILNKVHSRYAEMLEETKSVYEETEQKIQGLSEEMQWVNWMERFSKSLQIENLNEEKQREFLQGLVSKIVVKSEYGYGRDKTKEVQRGHSLEFHYKLKIVEDEFQWSNKSSKPWRGEVIGGKKTEKSEMMRFVTSRKKKV